MILNHLNKKLLFCLQLFLDFNVFVIVCNSTQKPLLNVRFKGFWCTKINLIKNICYILFYFRNSFIYL